MNLIGEGGALPGLLYIFIFSDLNVKVAVDNYKEKERGGAQEKRKRSRS
jgi:hypothetical protein